jgi:hypothetical protein
MKTLKKLKTLVKSNSSSNKNRTIKLSKLKICSRNHVCIAFGHHVSDINRFFNHFSWKYVVHNKIHKVSDNTTNGFIYRIPFQNSGYLADAILKSCNKESSDNLFYEAMVGQFVNKLQLYYPLFTQTYNVGQYIDDDTHSDYKENNSLYILLKNHKNKKLSPLNSKPHKILEDNIKLYPIQQLQKWLSIESSCRKPLFNCIMTEYISSAITMNKYIDSHKSKSYFWENDFLIYIFQIYSILSNIALQFTHYDLHYNNVLLYSPCKSNECIRVNYHSGKNTITMYTNHVVKIIDYGRSFYYDTANNNSLKIYKEVCDSNICTEDPQYCGEDKGYYWLNKNDDNNYIHSKTSNQSHDLRLLSIIYKKYGDSIDWEPMRSFLSDIVYLHEYGTPQDMNNDNIRNIHTANSWITQQIKSEEFQKRNQSINANKKIIGTLDVWIDRSHAMKWITT